MVIAAALAPAPGVPAVNTAGGGFASTNAPRRWLFAIQHALILIPIGLFVARPGTAWARTREQLVQRRMPVLRGLVWPGVPGRNTREVSRRRMVGGIT